MCFGKIKKGKKKNKKNSKSEKRSIPSSVLSSNEINTIEITEEKVIQENDIQEKQINEGNKISVEIKDETPTQSSLPSSSQPPKSEIPASSPPIVITPPNINEEVDSIKPIKVHEPDESNSDINLKNESDSKTPLNQMNSVKVTGKAALKIFTTSLAAAKPFFPWIESVTAIINEIVNQYEAVEYNKKTCLVLVERVEHINLSVKTLSRRREENFDKFQNEDYYHSFIKLEKVLKLVRDFVCDISELKGYRKFILASDVKNKANQLLGKLDECCNNLQFAIIISQETRKREQQSLDEDVAIMTKFLESIGSEVHAQGEKTSKVLNRIYEEVTAISQVITELSEDTKEAKEKSLLNKQTIFNAPTIDPKELYNIEESVSNIPFNYSKDSKIIKKLLRNTVPVACEKVDIDDNNPHETKRINAELSILNSIQSSNKIIKFHGKSEVNNIPVLVFDWAEHGNLRRLYERDQLKWVDKLKIAHDIASGLVFLQACKIYHHDIRCENILITGDTRYEAKIARFRQSRQHHELSKKIPTFNTIIRWLAPEKMPKNSKPSKEPYTFKSEIFSFAMLLWELGAQKFPYKDKEMKEIISHVTSKNRESFKDFNPSNNVLYHESIAKGFVRIIESGWAHESNQRPTINNIYQELDRLVETHSPRKRPNGSSGDVSTHSLPETSSNNNSTIVTPEEDEDNLIALETIITLDEGILAHRNGNREVAWKCFELHATLGDPMAIYWKAYYYLKGYHGKADTNEAIKYFKQAADANVPEAQYYYANALEKAKKPGFLFLEYFTKAADNDNVNAQRELGRIYYYGLNGVEKNEEKGIQYLKLAAVKNHQAAIDDLKKIDPNLIVSAENKKKPTN